jgi:hypothetical protein
MSTLKDLIARRCAELAISNDDLARELNIRRRKKARDFRNRLASDDMRGMAHLRRPLARVLDIDPSQVQAAIEGSRVARHARFEADRRACFRPHAVLFKAHRTPQPPGPALPRD